MLILSTAFAGLGTYTVNIPTTDTYSITGTLTNTTHVPGALQGPGGGAGTGTGGGPELPSQVVITIKQNASTILTTAAGAQGFTLPSVQLSAGDTLNFITSSSAARDQHPNLVKLTISVSEGPA